MEPREPPGDLERLTNELMAGLETPGFDLEGFLAAHPEHAARLRRRFEDLNQLGFVGGGYSPGSVRARIAGLGADPVPVHVGGEGADGTWRLGERYEVRGEIGRGGMGVVFRAFDVELNREVALKFAGDPLAGGGIRALPRRVVDRFLAEAQITAQLSHPAIVPVHEIGVTDDDNLFYSMMLVEGESLHALLAGPDAARLGGSRARAELVLRVCEALAFAHRSGFVHRDLKPSNVMVGRFDEVFVMDWGLAKIVGAEEGEPGPPPIALPHEQPAEPTRAGAALGTVGYMSPEQELGLHEQVDQQTDVFGIGAILFALLTGRAPVPREAQESPPESRKLSWRAQDRSIPRELRAICDKALAARKQRRYASVRELQGDLRAYLAGEPGSAWEDSLAVRAARVVRRHPNLSMGALALAVVLGVSWGAGSRVARAEGRLELTREQFDEILEFAFRDTRRENRPATSFEGPLVIGEHEARIQVALDRMALNLEPESVAKQLQLAFSLDQAGRYAEAEVILGGLALTGSEAELEVFNNYGALLYDMDEFERSLEVLERALAVAPDDGEVHYNIGNSKRAIAQRAGDQGLLLQAVAQFELAHRFAPDFGLLYGTWGNALMSLGRFEEALHRFEQGVELQPDWARSHFNLGSCFEALGDPTQAEACYRQAIELDGKYAKPRNNLAVILQNRWEAGDGDGYSDEAFLLLVEAVGLDPDDPDYRSNLGEAFALEGKPEIALDCFRSAADLDPEDAGPRINIAAALAQLGRWEEARAEAEHAAELDPDFDSTFELLHGICLELGDEAGAELAEQELERIRSGK